MWCDLIHRDAAGTLWASQSAYTVDPILNEGGLENKSVDVGLAYKFDMGEAGRIRTRLDGTYLLNLIYRPGLGTALPGKEYDCAGKFGSVVRYRSPPSGGIASRPITTHPSRACRPA